MKYLDIGPAVHRRAAIHTGKVKALYRNPAMLPADKLSDILKPHLTAVRHQET
jgi:hypothetical protein